MKKHKIKIRYDYGGFQTQGDIVVESRSEQAAKTKALKTLRKELRKYKQKTLVSLYD